MTTLALPTALCAELTEMAREDEESAGVVLAAIGRDDRGGIRLIGIRYVPVNEAAYTRRERDGLSITSDGWMPALQEAAQDGLVGIWTHTHPGDGASPAPSNHDRIVNEQLRETFKLRTGSEIYASFIVSTTAAGRLAFTGELDGETRGPIEKVVISDDGLTLIEAADQANPELGELHSRHVLAFGSEIPLALQAMEIAIVGAGGTGSATAELLVRLGARRVTLIDDDVLSLSNTTRVFGSTPADVGRPKVEILADHLRRIAPDIELSAIQGRITSQSVARRLIAADVIFGCTDDNAGRARLSRLPYAYSSLVIDSGVQIVSTAGMLEGIFGRVTSLYRGVPCLLCRGRIDLARLAAEERPAADQQALVAQGYAPELGQVEPAVVAYTAAVAAASVGELLELMVGFGDHPRPSELILRFHERDIRSTIAVSRPGCYCDLGSRGDRQGDRGLFLGVNWVS